MDDLQALGLHPVIGSDRHRVITAMEPVQVEAVHPARIVEGLLMHGTPGDVNNAHVSGPARDHGQHDRELARGGVRVYGEIARRDLMHTDGTALDHPV